MTAITPLDLKFGEKPGMTAITPLGQKSSGVIVTPSVILFNLFDTVIFLFSNFSIEIM